MNWHAGFVKSYSRLYLPTETNVDVGILEITWDASRQQKSFLKRYFKLRFQILWPYIPYLRRTIFQMSYIKPMVSHIALTQQHRIVKRYFRKGRYSLTGPDESRGVVQLHIRLQVGQQLHPRAAPLHVSLALLLPFLQHAVRVELPCIVHLLDVWGRGWRDRHPA